MIKTKKFFIFFTGYYEGILFSNEIVGMADSLEEARVLLQQIKDEDKEMLDEPPTGYYIKEQELFMS